MIRIEGHGNSTEALTIRALPQFNETEVVCVLYIFDLNGTVTVDKSSPVTLTVQGTVQVYPHEYVHTCTNLALPQSLRIILL